MALKFSVVIDEKIRSAALRCWPNFSSSTTRKYLYNSYQHFIFTNYIAVTPQEHRVVSNHLQLNCCSTVCLGWQHRKHPESVLLAQSEGNLLWMVDSPYKAPVIQKLQKCLRVMAPSYCLSHLLSNCNKAFPLISKTSQQEGMTQVMIYVDIFWMTQVMIYVDIFWMTQVMIYVDIFWMTQVMIYADNFC